MPPSGDDGEGAKAPRALELRASTVPPSGDDGEPGSWSGARVRRGPGLQRGRRLETTESGSRASGPARAPSRRFNGAVVWRRRRAPECGTVRVTNRSPASTGPSSGDDGERARCSLATAPSGPALASTGPSSGDDGEHTETCFVQIADDRVASTGPSSGDDGEGLYQTNLPVGSHSASTGPSSGDDGERPFGRRPRRAHTCAASTGPSSGDDGENVRTRSGRLDLIEASTGPSSGDDGERQAIKCVGAGETASTGPSSGDDGELATSYSTATRRELQRGRRLETTERAHPLRDRGPLPPQASTGPSSGDDGEMQYRRRVAPTDRASTGPSSGDDGEAFSASTGPSSGDDGEAWGRPGARCRGTWLQRGRRLETTERVELREGLPLTHVVLQRGRRLETTESRPPPRLPREALRMRLQRGRRLETTERGRGPRPRALLLRRVSTGPSSGDDGESPLTSTWTRRACFNGAVVWRRRRAELPTPVVPSYSRLQRGRRLETTERCRGIMGARPPRPGLQRGRRLETTESWAEEGTGSRADETLQRGRRLETTESRRWAGAAARSSRGFNGAVVWRRRRDQPDVRRALGVLLASTGPSSGDDGESTGPSTPRSPPVSSLQRGRRLETTESRGAHEF